MAQRRMFSLQIVDSDAFLDMPQSTQLLYFHLAMRGDDDGFVDNPKKIMRMSGSNDDDLKVLMTKRFILSFQSGVIVIKHWRIHNYIQNDRYHETKYVDEKNGLLIKENGSYTECIQPVSRMDTEVRLGKVRLEQGKVSEDASLTPAQEAKSFFDGEFEPVLKEFVEKTHSPPEAIRNEFSKFILYWTEKNKSGTKQKWELQKTFEVRRRLATWLGNVKQFSKVEFSKGRGLA